MKIFLVSRFSHGPWLDPNPRVTLRDDDSGQRDVRGGLRHGCPGYFNGPATEPWGVRRFYVRDPFGKLINILQHE
jgi:hypothetical protein